MHCRSSLVFPAAGRFSKESNEYGYWSPILRGGSMKSNCYRTRSRSPVVYLSSGIQSSIHELPAKILFHAKIRSELRERASFRPYPPPFLGCRNHKNEWKWVFHFAWTYRQVNAILGGCHGVVNAQVHQFWTIEHFFPISDSVFLFFSAFFYCKSTVNLLHQTIEGFDNFTKP